MWSCNPRNRPDDAEIVKNAMKEWRNGQQKEWNRLSMMLVLLATTSSAILAVADAPPLPFFLWLGAAGLSISGLFILQYFSIKALSIQNEEMAELVQEQNPYIGGRLLAMVVAGPVVMALWSSVMFTLGIIIFAVQSPLGSAVHKSIAIIPVGCGIISATGIVILGELIDFYIWKKKSARQHPRALATARRSISVVERGSPQTETSSSSVAIRDLESHTSNLSTPVSRHAPRSPATTRVD